MRAGDQKPGCKLEWPNITVDVRYSEYPLSEVSL